MILSSLRGTSVAKLEIGVFVFPYGYSRFTSDGFPLAGE